MPCCARSEIVAIPAAFGARAERACVACGTTVETPARRLTESERFMLLARERLGRDGDWRGLGLPPFERIGLTVGPPVVVRTLRRRLSEASERLALPALEDLLRDAMALQPTLWPRTVRTACWPHPVIVHHGLPHKFARKGDRGHIDLCGYTHDAIAHPTEVWRAVHRGKPYLRFLKKFVSPSEAHILLACVDARTSLVVTSYTLTARQCDANRSGTFLFASWAAD
jgi:hypothetical protein